VTAALIAFALLLQAPPGVQEHKAANGVSYCLRLPPRYNPQLGAPAVVWLHGSNMNSVDYVSTFIAQKWFPDWILIGIDGETGTKDQGHNYTFNSAKFIVEVYDEIARKTKITKAFIGGHSQGGFVTYSVVMEYPDKFAGAVPVSGGLWMQCEPDSFKPEAQEKQKKTALAIVHGRADEIVGFDMAESAQFSFIDAGYPMVRLFDPEKGDHRFALLPIKEAIEWCDAMTQADPKMLAVAATTMAAQKQYRSASSAGQRARSSTALKAVEQAAAAAAKPLAAKIAKSKDDAWVRDFWAFRHDFQYAEAAKPLLEVYAKLRAEHQRPAEDLFFKARADFQRKDSAAAYKKYEEIVAKYFASRWYFYAKRGLEARK
jgi:predicted esterase